MIHADKNPIANQIKIVSFAVLGLLLLFHSYAFARVEINITKGNVEPLPIAITDFLGSELAQKISSVVETDLKNSGLFRPLDRTAFIEKISNSNAVPRFEDWRVINAQALVSGQVTRENDGRLKAEFRLWDVFAGEQLIGQQFFTGEKNWRRVAHIIADAIYEKLTGEKGYFDTRIVFVDEQGPKSKRVKRLAIMDQDGANQQILTKGSDLVLTPRFSPTRQEITYMSFDGGEPRVYLLQIATGKREIVGNFPGHDIFSTLFTGRAKSDHEPTTGWQCEHLYNGFAIKGHHQTYVNYCH